jgi:hypothetical protein
MRMAMIKQNDRNAADRNSHDKFSFFIFFITPVQRPNAGVVKEAALGRYRTMKVCLITVYVGYCSTCNT